MTKVHTINDQSTAANILQESNFWDGCNAFSHAIRQSRVGVLAAYPITPCTPILQNYSKFMARDQTNGGEFIMAASEHLAISACINAAVQGHRVATTSASQGLALMIELMYQASGMRLPIVMCLVNRALVSPLNIYCDHSDMYLCRDAGWIQFCAFDQQAAYDLAFCAFRVGEKLRLPVILNQDGFLTSHTKAFVQTFGDQDAYNFVGQYIACDTVSNFDQPVTYQAQTKSEWHMEHKMRQNHALHNSFKIIDEVFEDFKIYSGRSYEAVPSYKAEDADEIIIAIGSVFDTIKVTVDELRKQGKKVDVIGICVWRPFPKKQLFDKIKNVKCIAVLDRSAPMGSTGALFQEVAAVLVQHNLTKPTLNYIYGLGGRAIKNCHIMKIYEDLAECSKANKRILPLIQTVNLQDQNLSFY